jgi:hypothetical protein
MRNSPVAEIESERAAQVRTLAISPERDDGDEEDEADFDDDEEPSYRHEAWLSMTGFASPEWWSRC